MMNLLKIRILNNPHFQFVVIGLLLAVLSSGCASRIKPGQDLQAVLDSGRDLALLPGKVYEINKTLTYKKPGQKIYTLGAKYPSEYATLKLANKDLMMLISAHGIEGAELKRVICDGDRYNLSVVPKPKIGGGGQPALVHFGGDGGHNQIVRDCVFINTRTWSTLKFHEGSTNVLAEDNLFFGAGVDPRGNGRDLEEQPFGWADGISCAATDSLIRNNLIIDPTDVGVVLYCAPGTIVEDNAIATISRESLGGINLVDGLDYFKMENPPEEYVQYLPPEKPAAEIEELKKKNRYVQTGLYDYRGVKIRDNYVDAFGGRIHMHIPVGCVVWVPHWRGKILYGGEVTDNILAGGAGAYGIVAHGLIDWEIEGNVSTASYSGLAEYGDHGNPPHGPAPFLYDGPTVIDCELQDEFIPREKHIEHLLRTQHAPSDPNGYQMHDYGDAEVEAVVDAAYIEMLTRKPYESEMKKSIEQLRTRKVNADGLRRSLMETAEFKKRFGDIPSKDLQAFRVQRWFDVCDALIRESGGMPDATYLYKKALVALRKK